MLMAVVTEIAETHVPDLAKKRMARVAEGGLGTIKFGWMGGGERGQPHYYRIQGKTFLIELDNTQNDANHVHIVWRDFENDFGRDLLEEHYRVRRGTTATTCHADQGRGGTGPAPSLGRGNVLTRLELVCGAPGCIHLDGHVHISTVRNPG